MNKKYSSWAVAAAIAAPLTAQAANPDDFDKRFYVAPFGQFTVRDGDRQADNGWGGGLALGKPISRLLNLELQGAYETLGEQATGPGEYRNIPFGLDALIFLKRTGLQPYLVLGGGGMYTKTDGNALLGVTSQSGTGWMANAGVGLIYPFNDTVALRTDARYRWDNNPADALGRSSFGDLVFRAGLQIALGPKPVPPVIPVAAPPPAPPPPPPPPAKLLPKKIDFAADALFDFDKAVLKPLGIEMLDELVSVLSGATFDTILAIGHTDPIGSDAYNQRLSERRAEAVEAYLVSKGISAERITAEGKGKTQLKITAADCKGKVGKALIECYAPNRRVETSVTGEKPQ